MDTQDSIIPVSEEITMKELGERSSQEMAPLTSVFFEDITEVNIKQDGLVEGSISPGSVILIDEK